MDREGKKKTYMFLKEWNKNLVMILMFMAILPFSVRIAETLQGEFGKHNQKTWIDFEGVVDSFPLLQNFRNVEHPRIAPDYTRPFFIVGVAIYGLLFAFVFYTFGTWTDQEKVLLNEIRDCPEEKIVQKKVRSRRPRKVVFKEAD